jgi:hypothetical protein
MSDVEKVATGIDLWLRTELRESHEGRNGYLDNFDSFREGFALPTDDQKNLDFSKGSDHFNRYNWRLGQVSEGMLAHGALTGILVHHALMFVSGGQRKQAYLQSGSDAEYEGFRFGDSQNRYQISCSLPVQAIVENVWPDVIEKPDLDEYVWQNESLNDAIRENHRSIYEWFSENPDRLHDALQPQDEPVQAMLETQRSGLLMTVSHVAVGAWFQKGQVGSVPVREAKSITDANKLMTWDEMIQTYTAELKTV